MIRSTKSSKDRKTSKAFGAPYCMDGMFMYVDIGIYVYEYKYIYIYSWYTNMYIYIYVNMAEMNHYSLFKYILYKLFIKRLKKHYSSIWTRQHLENPESSHILVMSKPKLPDGSSTKHGETCTFKSIKETYTWCILYPSVDKHDNKAGWKMDHDRDHEWRLYCISCSYFRFTTHSVTVTTRNYKTLAGNSYKASFATVTGWVVDPTLICLFVCLFVCLLDHLYRFMSIVLQSCCQPRSVYCKDRSLPGRNP